MILLRSFILLKQSCGFGYRKSGGFYFLYIPQSPTANAEPPLHKGALLDSSRASQVSAFQNDNILKALAKHRQCF